MSNVTTTRGAQETFWSIVDCSQLLATRCCTAVTYQEKREPKSPPDAPLKASPACVAPVLPIAKAELRGIAGAPPPPYGTAFSGGGVLFSSSLEGRELYLGSVGTERGFSTFGLVTGLGGLLFRNSGMGVASGGITGAGRGLLS